ncbi:MAG: glycosyltransferase family 4 protein [bacterium]|nr:glycosyltransferase family 4 protein [bacterium]
MKRILFVVHLPPPIHGVSVMNEIIRSSKSVNGAFNCHYINLSTAAGIDDLQKVNLRKYFLGIRVFLKVFLKIVTKKFDSVFISLFPFGPSFYKDSAIVLLAKLMGIQPILHLHTQGFRNAYQTSGLKSAFYKTVFRGAEVIVPAASMSEDISGIYSGRIHILPNGIPQVNFVNQYAMRPQTFRILYLSHLIRGKGILIALEAARILKEEGLLFKFHIAGAEGDISYSQLERVIVEYGLQNEIEVRGAKYGKEKQEEFEQADVFILPSNYDTFGLVLLEAMQYGVPCISSNTGAIPELLGNGRGLVLPDLSPGELAKAINFLANHPEERLRMSRAAFAHYEEFYTTTHFEKGLLAILSGQRN